MRISPVVYRLSGSMDYSAQHRYSESARRILKKKKTYGYTLCGCHFDPDTARYLEALDTWNALRGFPVCMRCLSAAKKAFDVQTALRPAAEEEGKDGS